MPICDLSFFFATYKVQHHMYHPTCLFSGLFPSRLLPCVTEHLTAEIVQSTVSDITRAIEWMKCSYLYVRMKKACSFSLLGGQNLSIPSLDSISESFHATIRTLRITQF